MLISQPKKKQKNKKQKTMIHEWAGNRYIPIDYAQFSWLCPLKKMKKN